MYYRGLEISWGDYLLLQSTNDLQKTIKLETTAIQKSLLGQTHDLVVSTETLSKGLDAGFSSIEGTISKVMYSIENFHSDFNYGMSLLLSRWNLLTRISRT